MAVDKYYYNLEVLCLTWSKEVAKFKIPLILPKLPHPTVLFVHTGTQEFPSYVSRIYIYK